MTAKIIEAIIKSLPNKTSIGPHGFSTELYKIFSEKLAPVLPKLFCLRKIKETLHRISCEDNISPISKPNKDLKKKEYYRLIHLKI